MLPQVSGHPGNATGAAADTAVVSMNSRNASTLILASVERVEENNIILRCGMLLVGFR